ncbi:hypothetical protein EXU57_20805 [Segetibacter sp. 3557_3]|uniref:beta-1,6-N-acetylglucosaminyltransferase n=1 Tax=Segetibacter sp. 3557_3 TaxID=2547429 RepID=UPI0010589569|nr:beta-1,6-N-acetylglucosaminyltransferase [Segetibacter sp. 3557_3]TDH20837.1 hypothetical protein EXU57_20805 [Segetibacter sp. 3557_3]
MRLGFLILSCNEPDEIYTKLLTFLSGFSNAITYVHHDFNQSSLSAEFISQQQIEIVKPHYKTYWSHVNNVLATIEGLRQMIKSSAPPDWFITLTPNCFPIKSKQEIETFFNNAVDDAYIDMHRVKDGNFGELDKWLLRDMEKQLWFRLPFLNRKAQPVFRNVRRKIPVARNPFLNGTYEYYHGSNYFFLNKTAALKLVNEDSLISDLIQFYHRYIIANPNMHPCPQETIIQTFLANQPDLKINFNNYRFIDWNNAVNWSPNWLTKRHFPEIKNTDGIWARKLRYPESKTLVDEIERMLL